MQRDRVRLAGRSLALAATTVAAMTAGLATATTAAAAPPLAPGLGAKDVSLSGATAAKPGQLPAGVPKKGTYSFLLALDTASTSSAANGAKAKGAAAARSAAKAQLTRIQGEQKNVAGDLPAGSTVLYRSHSLLAGVAVRTNVKNFASLQKIDGVTAVYPITPKKPTNSYAVPFQNGARAWQAYGETGKGSTIAVIDTGIDYTHADFGGPGTKAAFEAAGAADQQQNPSPDVFPTSKVIGGYDLVGDKYNADPTDPDTYDPNPVPDNNPLDCEGHGSHVAGTAAGVGVNADGSSYTGAYNTNTPFDSMKIGPGMAPEAKLYAFRVFGCAGSTDVTGAAIERAIDPNNDGDPSDHVDVANLSLGSDFTSPQDADALLVRKATAAGVTMVISSGNNGDLYDTGGSPGNAPSALTVASSQDAQSVVDALNITAPAAAQYPAERSIAYDWANDPDLAGTVYKLSSANPYGCNALTGADLENVAGKIAFAEWNDAKPECPSSQRGKNLSDAGATGFIFGSNSESFSAGITGSALIPGVLVAKSGADAIRSQLAAGQVVTVGSTDANAVKQTDEALNDTLSGFSSRGVRSENNLKPDVAAVGGTVFSAAVGTGTEGVNNSGTSMAAPMTAGLAGLVKSRHPGWTPEQVKADIMNTANHDVYTEPNSEGRKFAPNRVGAGRIDARQALANDVLAYVTPEPGATQEQKDALTGTVSASFGVIEATGDLTRSKTIKVENTGLNRVTYDVDYQSRTVLPGASYSVSPASVTVDPRSSKTVTVTLTITAAELTKRIDQSMETTQAGVSREFVADASGLVVLKPTADGAPNLRVPVYAAPRPASSMTQPSSVTFGGTGTVRTADLPLSGQRVNQGSGAAKVVSTVAGFELQATSPAAPTCSTTVTTKCVHFADERSADLKYVGATSSAPQLQALGSDPLTSDDGMAYFSVTTQGPWRSPVGFQAVEIYIDSNGDGKADAVTYTTRLLDGADQTDVLVAVTADLKTGKTLDIQGINDRLGNTDTALFDSDTMVLPVTLSALPGITADSSRIRYSVLSYSAGSSEPLDQVGDVTVSGTGENTVYSLVDPLSFDVLKPGVAVYGSYNGGTSPLLYADSPGTLLKIRRDATSYAADKGQGALIVHFHNAVGSKAQVVSLGDAKAAPAIKLAFSPATVKAGAVTAANVTVSNTGAAAATGTFQLRAVGANGSTAVRATGTLSNGTGRVLYRVPTTAGSYQFAIYYGGDANYTAGWSGKVNLTVTK